MLHRLLRYRIMYIFIFLFFFFFFFSSRRRHTRSVSAFLLNRSSDLTPSVDKQASHFVHIPGLSYSGVKSPTECQQSLLSLILHLGNLFLIVQLHFSKLFLILKSGVNHTSRGSISTSTLPSIKLRKCSSKIITSILSFISGRLATKSNQIKQLIRNGRSASLKRTFKKSFTSFSHSTRNKTRDGLIRVRNIRALNGRFNTSITHAYSIVIGSKHITLNATGGGFLTASKQFRHGATSKSRSNTASNSTKHKSPHLSGWRQIISLIT